MDFASKRPLPHRFVMQRTPRALAWRAARHRSTMSDKLRHRTLPAPRGALSNRALFVWGAVIATAAHFATTLI